MSANPLSPNNGGPPGPPAQANASEYVRFTPLDPLRVLRQHVRVLIVTGLIGIVLGVGLYVTLRKTSPQYTTKSLLLATGGVRSAMEETTEIPEERLENLAAFIQNEMAMLMSDRVLDRALRRTAITNTQWYAKYREDPRQAMTDLQEKYLRAVQPAGTTMVEVSLSGAEQGDLQVVLDTIVDVYLQENRQEKSVRIDNLRAVMTDAVDRNQRRIDDLYKDIRVYAEENQLPGIEDLKDSDTAVMVNGLSRQLLELQALHQEALAAYQGEVQKQQRSRISPTAEDLLSVAQMPSIATRKERVRSLRENRDYFINLGFGEQHKTIKGIDEQVAAIEQEIRRESERLLTAQREAMLQFYRAQVEQYSAQLKDLAARLEVSKARLLDISGKLQSVQQKKELIEQAKRNLEMAQQWLVNANIMANRPDARGIDRVQTATEAKMTFPTIPATVVGMTMLSLAMVTGLIFLKEMLDQRVKSPADLRLVPGGRMLGALPDAGDDPFGATAMEGVVAASPTGLMSEAFRQLRTELMTQVQAKGLRTIMLVGAAPQSGVSTVTQNLALSLSFSGKRVAVVDVNLRRPRQHELFEQSQSPGMTQVVRGEATLDAALRRAGEHSVWVLPVGATEGVPPEILESAAFESMLQQLASDYDIVLIDAPPAMLSSDSLMLARHVDAATLVVRASSDKRGMVGRILRMFTGQQTEVLGLVLNGVRSSYGGYFRKNYEAFYRYHNGGGRKRDRGGKPKPAKATQPVESES